MRGFALLALLLAAAPAAAEQSLQTLYTLKCSGCHGAEGKGVPDSGIPNLNDAGRYVGLPLGREYLIEVPGLSQSSLDDATAARMLNWVLARFSADRLPAGFAPYTTAEIARYRGDTASDAETRRQVILAQLKATGALGADYGAGEGARHP
jgi:mono/diheme cytochrome c family protein